jgi:hypothetical protein
MARLGGWKRIGIIASVVWFLGAGIFTYNGMEKYQREQFNAQFDLLWDKAADKARDKYLSEHPPEDLTKIYAANKQQTKTTEADQELERLASGTFTPDLVVCKDCVLLKEQFLTNHRRIALEASASVAFTTVALAWGLAYLILFLVRWVKRGFINAENSN